MEFAAYFPKFGTRANYLVDGFCIPEGTSERARLLRTGAGRRLGFKARSGVVPDVAVSTGRTVRHEPRLDARRGPHRTGLDAGQGQLGPQLSRKRKRYCWTFSQTGAGDGSDRGGGHRCCQKARSPGPFAAGSRL